ncbi:hypothetical protein [Neobacillus sp. LXY-1]|uniref:hypothetical protein n=1 Tax=Neobacillus sp. LXY-1 TaxID=3379133 RepID=UPI003EDF072C
MKSIYNMTVILIALFATCAIFSYPFFKPNVQETITFFPINPQVKFKTAETELKLDSPLSILWKEGSTLDRKAYLRQDVGLLFANGKLIAKMGDWKQNAATISQQKKININQNQILQAITFHHAEIHEANQIYSAQKITNTTLYTALQSPNKLYTFQFPKTAQEQQLKEKLDQHTVQLLQNTLNKGDRHFFINLKSYRVFHFTEFFNRAAVGLPGMSRDESEKVVGQLWEGLYKGYFLGIKKKDGTVVDPIGSTIPIILLANDQSHLLVLTETANGEPILLRQMI